MSELKKKLNNILKSEDEEGTPSDVYLKFARMNIRDFIINVVLPSYHELKTELEEHGKDVVIDVDEPNLNYASIIVYTPSQTNPDEEIEEFCFRIRGKTYQKMQFAFPQHAEEDQPRVQKAEILLRTGTLKEYDLEELTTKEIIDRFLGEYEKWIKY
ncbi:MAG: hypothetical protein K8R11_00060 [Methanococcoides sp.]|nr:hypothetical protein [Methanococcoides sp.]